MSDLTTRIHKALTEIARSYDQTLDPAHRLIETHALTNLTNPPLPISANILDTRAKACETLDHWYIHTRTARKLTTALERWDVTGLVAFLTTHAAWLADTPDGGRAAAQLEASSRALVEIATDTAPHRFKVGHCPGTTNGQPCPGTVRATVRSDDDLLPSELACDATPRHAWPSGEWRLLERRLHANAAAARRMTATRGECLNLDAARRLLAAISATH